MIRSGSTRSTRGHCARRYAQPHAIHDAFERDTIKLVVKLLAK
jgi:hypothetical protein